jgi:N-acyl-D-amino-acid deacylase
MYDLLIRDGRIVDGMGNPWRGGDVGITNGRIAGVGRLGNSKGKREIDAGGLTISPGFIDVHTHSEISVLAIPTADSKVMQGVTTEVCGNCGFSVAPLRPETAEFVKSQRGAAGFPDFEWEWTSVAEYLKVVERTRPSVNVALYLGQGAIRASVMEFANRAPTEAELEEMRSLVDVGMRDGAFGMSTGLKYVPGVYANTEEIVELARVVARHGGTYSSHLRNQSDRLVESFHEAIAIGNRAKIRVNVSHHKVIGRAPEFEGRARQTLALIEKAREAGLDVVSDQYPYVMTSGSLTSNFPPWALEGGMDAFLERLSKPEMRDRIHKDWEDSVPGWDNRVKTIGWPYIHICDVAKEADAPLIGKSVAECAAQQEQDPGDFAMDLLVRNRGRVRANTENQLENNIELIMKHPTTMFGSDGTERGGRSDHPRTYGTFPRVLGRYVREEKLLPLEEAIRKMTSFPASRLDLEDRGIIRTGAAADITIFDPDTVIDRATYAEPRQHPEGIPFVIVNGEVVVDHGEHTGARPGRALRHSDKS